MRAHNCRASGLVASRPPFARYLEATFVNESLERSPNGRLTNVRCRAFADCIAPGTWVFGNEIKDVLV